MAAPTGIHFLDYLRDEFAKAKPELAGDPAVAAFLESSRALLAVNYPAKPGYAEPGLSLTLKDGTELFFATQVGSRGDTVPSGAVPVFGG